MPRLRKLAKYDDGGPRAAQAFIHGLLESGAEWSAMSFVQDNEHWLREHTMTWAAGGSVFVQLGHHRKAVQWNADWRDRRDAKPWMLANVAESLRAQGQEEEAVEVSHHALAMSPSQGQSRHRLWLAIDAASEGDIGTARGHFTQIPPDRFRVDDRFDRTLVASVIQMFDASQEERAQVFAEVRRRLADGEADAPELAFRAALKRSYRRCLAQIARSRGTIGAQLWALHKWLLSWSPTRSVRLKIVPLQK